MGGSRRPVACCTRAILENGEQPGNGSDMQQLLTYRAPQLAPAFQTEFGASQVVLRRTLNSPVPHFLAKIDAVIM